MAYAEEYFSDPCPSAPFYPLPALIPTVGNNFPKCFLQPCSVLFMQKQVNINIVICALEISPYHYRNGLLVNGRTVFHRVFNLTGPL